MFKLRFLFSLPSTFSASVNSLSFLMVRLETNHLRI